MTSVAKQPSALVVSPVMPYPPVGGGHKRILRLMEAMERAGAVPHLLTEQAGDPEAATALRDRGWGVEVLPEPSQGLGRRAVQHAARRPSPYLRGVAARLGELSPGAAFVEFEHVQSAYYFRATAGRRVVLSAHNVDSQVLTSVARAERPMSIRWARSWNRAHAARSTERRATARVDAVLCVSTDDAGVFFGRLARETVVAANGVDDEFFAVPDAPPRSQDVLFFGHFGYVPNVRGLQRFLADGWPAVAAARPEARLRIAGAAVPADLARLAARVERVEILGFVDELAAELARACVVIVPLWQGGGTRLKVIEAMAAARAVVGTSLGVQGIGFRDGEHGCLAETADGLAAALVRLLAEPDAAARLGRAAREHARASRWEAALAPAEALYRRWLASPARTS